jgi:ribose transport system substrate-binding protein
MLVIAAVAGVALSTAVLAGASPQALGPYRGPEHKLPTDYPRFTVEQGAEITIGYQVVADNEANVASVKLAKLEAKRLGVKLVILYNHVSADKQVTDFNQMIAQKVDAIIFHPLDRKAVRPSLAKAKAAGIPTLGMDGILAGEKLLDGMVTAAIAGRDHLAYLGVQEMARQKPGAKIVVMGLGFPVATLEYYVQRVQYWAKKAGLTVVARADNPTDNEAGGERAMRPVLARYPDIDGVIAYNDPSALGAVAAARASGKSIIAIGTNGGSDARNAVERGRLQATVQAAFPGIVRRLIDAAYILATKQRASVPPVVLPTPYVVNKSNIDRMPSWDDEIEALERKVKGS